jgi:hypothetical protein
MSVFLSMVGGDAVRIVTDGASYDQAGRLVAISEKVWRSPHMPLAVTGRGNPDNVRRIAEAVVHVSGLVPPSQVPGALFALVDMLGRASRAPGTNVQHVECLVATWTEEWGPRHVFFSSHARHAGVKPFTLTELDNLAGIGLHPSREDFEAAGVTAHAFEAAGDAALEIHGAAIMEAFRRKPALVAMEAERPVPGTVVGGHCQLTTVGRKGASTVTLCTWPDRIGEPVDPLSGYVLADRAAGGRARRWH